MRKKFTFLAIGVICIASNIMSDDELTRKFVPLLDKVHVERLVYILSTVGLWPHQVMGQRKWFTKFKNFNVLFPIWLCAFLSSVSYLKKYIKVLSLIEMGACSINISMMFIGLQRITLARSEMYIKTTREFFCKIHLFHYKDQHAYAKKIYNMAELVARSLCLLGIGEVYPGALCYMCTPIYRSYRSGMFQSSKPVNATYEHAIYYDLPFDYTTNTFGFLVVYFFTFFLVFDIGVIFMVLDYYMMVIVAHLWGHIKILKYNLSMFPQPENKNRGTPWYNEDESRNIRNLLIDHIKHYTETGTYIKQVSKTFETTLCFYFFFFQISLCIFLLEISQLNLEIFATYGMLTFSLSQQLITMSVMFELIGSQSETIKDSVYQLPWECMDVKNRKLVLFFLFIVQEPVHIKALGLVPVGVQTMSKIIKNTLSYFMLLRTTAATH